MQKIMLGNAKLEILENWKIHKTFYVIKNL